MASSPYLKQHADNPVDWFEWGEEALSKAKNENKPLIISIGYAACHWCHVMANESFMNEEIATWMNTHFVCIKIDREERPDIDRIYMEAAQLLSGRGGWPLNAFALPDGRPFYAATYFPPNQWLDALNQLSHLYTNDYPRIEQAAEGLTEGIRNHSFAELDDLKPFERSEYQASFQAHIRKIDFELGGYLGAPKFMMPTGLEFLLQYHHLTNDQKALDAVLISLDAMAQGGIYDQIGGGFARYSTDENWLVPHFEKMLYDNAQLVSLYSHAYQVTQNPLYAEILIQTISFLEREMRHSNGGFYASIDADSEHEEGKFYVWTKEEIESIVDPQNLSLILRFYQISASGNWEHHKNILHYKESKADFGAFNNLSLESFEAILNEANQALLKSRNLRVRPATDDKILTSWNALMITGYVNAYKALSESSYLAEAMKTARFLEAKMLTSDGILYRVYKDEKVTVEAFLDDYTLFSEACLNLYEVTFDLHWLSLSEKLIQQVWDHFRDSKNQLFYYTSDQSEELIARKHETSDNVIPASNSVAAHVLHRLGTLTEQIEYTQMALQMGLNLKSEILQHGAYYANWAMLLGQLTYPNIEVAILGRESLSIAQELQRNYLPNVSFAGGQHEDLPILKHRLVMDSTLVYVCKDNVCNLPVSSVDKALALLNAE
jgi:uncharacterized protein YyaL (SSP411 family)